jgi:flagellar basal body P-ring protein FlgI
MAALAGLLCLLAGLAAAQPVRIKDIADIEGVRDNQLVGYGLVVGLNGIACLRRASAAACAEQINFERRVHRDGGAIFAEL